ncbi:CHAD domain-containing protein [Dyella lipolytica]|uniref:CHAD domain-containing protein n=1 Tax=Dyella lipolytica TaxID=1867835 RepID=A0ABW8IXJ0_9GAMM|nr:CHAD domain-containing protein [Dyella lipolytica]
MNDAKQCKSLDIGSALGALAAKECQSLEHALALRKGRHDGIHEARKSSRRLRSLLAFLEPRSDRRIASLDKTLKQLVDSFSALRDAHVAARTARLLAATHAATLTPSLMDALEHRSAALLDEALENDPHWRRRSAKVRRIAVAIEGLPWQQVTPSTAKKVLKQHVQRMKKVRQAALEERTTPAFHRWRRRARQVRYQLEFLRTARRKVGMKKRRTEQYEARIKRLSLLSDRLGWRQDFQVFMSALDQLPASIDIVALRAALSTKSATLSKVSPPEPVTKSVRMFIAHGSR